MTVIEKVADAITDRVPYGLLEDGWVNDPDLAIAALSALLGELPPLVELAGQQAMFDVGIDDGDMSEAAAIFRAMIQAVLDEVQP